MSRQTPGHVQSPVDSIDQTNILVDTNGVPYGATAPFPVAGTGVAGTPAGGVQTVQGITGGTPVIVVGSKLNDGTVTATGGSHLTVGGVNPSGNYLPNSVTAAGAVYTADMGALDAAVRSASVSSGTTGDTFDTTGYGSVTFQTVANASSNTWLVEGSNDGGTTWGGIATRSASTSGSSAASPGTGASNSSTAGTTIIPTVIMPKMRWRVSTFIGGTTTIAVGLKRQSSPNVMDVNVGNGALVVSAGPRSTAGLVPFRVTTGASGAGKSGTSQLYAWDLLNTTASIRYFQFYNKATAGIPGTDTPIYTVPLAANGVRSSSSDVGITIGTSGCSWAITTDAPGATIASSGDVTGSFGTN